MSFEQKLQDFVLKVESFKDSISTEEATKTSVILPFFQLLGYDVFNPSVFVPEFVADVGIKRGEKVDYAIMKDGKPVIIIEAKSINRNLEKHDSQLFRYFTTTPAKFAILTNGIRYRFYTDLDDPNKMDTVPFLDFDLLHMKNQQIEALQNFRKENFSVEKISESASDLKYKDQFKRLLSAEIEQPSDGFVRYILKDIYLGIKTQNVIDRFRPLLKDSFSELISEIMNDKIKNALSVTSTVAVTTSPETDTAATVSVSTPQPLSLSPLEKNAYIEIQKMFDGYLDPKDIFCKKTESYLAILYQNNTRKWICRLVLSNSQKSIILPDAEKKEIRRKIANIYELHNYKNYLRSVASRFGPLLSSIETDESSLFHTDLIRRFPKYTNFLPDGTYEKV